MKFDFDEFTFQDEINFMSLNHQMGNQQFKTDVNPSIEFNEDTIYNRVGKK